MSEQTAQADQSIPVSTVLARVGAELDDLALSIDNLQVLLSALLSSVARDKPQALVEAQRLDAISQTLASLSTFVVGMSQAGSVGHPVEIGPIANLLPLSDLADRLLGRPASDASGEFELF